MKTPRITDFDPDAKTPVLKSTLEKMPTIEKPKATGRPPDDQTARRSDRPTAIRGGLVRRGFDWYADQLDALKKLSLGDQMEGRTGSMSAMVREALDEYLKKRNAQK